MNLQEVLSTISNRISQSSQYLYESYGKNEPRTFEFCNIDEEATGNFTADLSGKVYEIIAEIPDLGKCYRWVDPEFKDALFQEHIRKGFDPSIAWDDVKFIEIESPDDMLIKTQAICNKFPFDDRITIPLDLSDEDFFRVAKMAHEKDITFNDMFVIILQDEIQNIKEQTVELAQNGYSQEEISKIISEKFQKHVQTSGCCNGCEDCDNDEFDDNDEDFDSEDDFGCCNGCQSDCQEPQQPVKQKKFSSF